MKAAKLLPEDVPTGVWLTTRSTQAQSSLSHCSALPTSRSPATSPGGTGVGFLQHIKPVLGAGPHDLYASHGRGRPGNILSRSKVHQRGEDQPTIGRCVQYLKRPKSMNLGRQTGSFQSCLRRMQPARNQFLWSPWLVQARMLPQLSVARAPHVQE